MKSGIWTSELETGLSALDSDHKELLSKVNRVKRASTAANLAELKSALLDLKDEMSAHFVREERLMSECKYEASGEHWDEHQRLLAETQEKIEELEEFESRVSTFGNYIQQTVFQHIGAKDMLFGRAVLEQIGATDRRQGTDEKFDAFEEKRLNNLEAIRWPADISTGIEAIDSDYPAMIDLLNQIIAARKSSDRDKLASLIEQFGNKTESHFRKEEDLMSSIDYDQNSTHREEHRKLLDEFSQLVDDWRRNHISAELLCRFIYRWMLRHIAASDIPLGAAISQQSA